MGIDYHTLNFVRYAASKQRLGRAITIGRQEIHVNSIVLKRELDFNSDQIDDIYCERLFMDALKASSVDSLDISDFEGATILHDMNATLPARLHHQFDTVLDSGTTEHVFNAPHALKSISKLCKVGGQIIHIVPSNNFCGHGFWQMSPELFFSLYSERNGYKNTQVYLADLANKWRWYEVLPPSSGKRVNVRNNSETYVMVRTVLAVEDFRHDDVQQSDYLHEWTSRKRTRKINKPAGLKGTVMSIPLLYDFLFPLYRRLANHVPAERLSARNPGLRPVDVHRLYKPSA